MKLANHGGRAALVLDDGIAVISEASGGRFGPDSRDNEVDGFDSRFL
jgi:hypothetical protein